MESGAGVMEVTVAGIAGLDIGLCKTNDDDNIKRDLHVAVGKSNGIASVKCDGRGRH